MAKGGYKGSSPARETSPEEYSGVWDIVEQYGEQKAGSWPFQETDCAQNSLRFDGSSSYLSKTPIQAGNKRTWTFSFWVKRCNVGSATQVIWMAYNAAIDEANYATISFTSTGQLRVGYAYDSYKTTTALYRDPSAWMHCCVSVDTNHAVASERVQIAINGVKQTEFAVSHDPDLGQQLAWNGAYLHHLGSEAGQQFSDNYLSEIQFVDGQQLSCDEFGFYDGQGIWMPKRFTGDYSSGPIYSNGTLSANPHAGNIKNVFDSNIHPQQSLSGSAGNQFYVYNQTAITYTFPQPLTGTFKVYVGNGDWNGSSSSSGGTISINTGASVTLPTPGTQFYYATVGAGTNVTSIRFTPANGGILLGAIYVDDVQLVDPSVGLNSFHLDFSNGVKDQSGLGNDWTANNVDAGAPRIETTGDITLSSQNRNFFFKGAVGQSIGVAAGNFVWDSADGVSWSYRGQSGTSVTLTSAYIYLSGTTNIAFTNTNLDSVVYWDAALGYGLPNSAGSGSAETFDVEANGSDGADRFVDSPVNGNEASTSAGGERKGNYCCFNPLDKHSALTISDGNLKVQASAAQWELARSTFFLKTGKHYWEFTWTGSVTSSSGVQMGLKTPESTLSAAAEQAGSYAFQYTSIYLTAGSLNTVVISPGSITSGDVVMFAYDADAGKMWIGVNGTWNGSGNPATGANPDWTNLPKTGLSPFAGCYGSSNVITLNAGQKAFEYTNHSGFSPLATSFLPEPTIKRGDEAMDVALWQGNGSVQTIENLRFEPGLVWIKSRDDAYGPALYDQVRGVNKRLRTDDQGGTNAEQTQTDGLSAFTEDGFTLGSHNAINESPDDYVGWIWRGGDTTATIAVGSLNSSAYNTSRVWSGDWTSGVYYTTYTPDKVFDGKLNTNVAVTYPSASTTITINPAISGSVIEVYYARSNNTTAGSIGSETLPSTGAGNVYAWHTLSATSISSMTLSHGNGGSTYIAAIRVDGRLLVDEFNNSQTWSNGLTGLSNSTITNATRAFNGDAGDYADSTAGFTVDLSGHTFGTGAHTIEVLSGGATSFSVNGSTNLTDPGGGGAKIWTGTHTGELTSLASSATGASIYYLKIDGKMLVDTGEIVGPDVPAIASTVRARPEVGLSIVQYTGTGAAQTAAHQLNKKPDLVLLKNLDTASTYWQVYSDHFERLQIPGTQAELTDGYTLDRTKFIISPTGNSVTNNQMNNSGDRYIALCFSAIDQYSSFGVYSGNGSATDGPFVYTGFRVRFLMVRSTSSPRRWAMFDTARFPFNGPQMPTLYANFADAETTNAENYGDFLSNGFKPRYNNGNWNASGETYFYLAFSEHPFASNCRAR